MPLHEVASSAVSRAGPDEVWATVRDFCAPWHPFVQTMEAEVDPSGRLMRAFKVAGEDTIYRERLTYLSHSDRHMRYRHRAGIAGVERYNASLTVAPEGTGSLITMAAELGAKEPRAGEIAQGTQAVFDAGVKALAEAEGLSIPEGLSEAPAPVPLETITLDHAPALTVTATPKGSDTLVLFLHGIGGNRGNWTQQLHAAAPHARAAALDLRGYGDSASGGGQSTVDDYCADIARVADALGAKHLILCGLSYGAWIATSFALRHPERLRGLVVSGGCTGMSEADAAERAAFRATREVPLDAGQTPADFAPAVVEIIAGPDASEPVRAALTASMASIPTATYRDALRCFTNPPERFDFADLCCPVLLMTGAHDRLAPPKEIRSVAQWMWETAPSPDVQFEVIAGAGHLCNLENPAGYNASLIPFITRLSP